MQFIKPLYAICNPLLGDCASDTIAANPISYVNNVIETVITLFLIVGTVYFIWHVVMSAYHMISSQGDPKKFEEAQKSLLYSIVGIVVVFSIFMILSLIGTIFGINSLKTFEIKWPTL